MRALVVDDSAAMRRIQQRALESGGWEVAAAASGEQAIGLLDAGPPVDLVLTDWHMPGMDGLDLVRAIRQNPRFEGVRILMVTSDAVMDSIALAIAAGANDFLMKPFSAQALADRIADVMNA